MEVVVTLAAVLVVYLVCRRITTRVLRNALRRKDPWS
jgi:hypothetical protein